MLKEIRHNGSFRAIGDDGKDYTINMFTEIIAAGTFSDPGAEIEGMKSLKTDEGHAVNYVEKGKYKIVSLGVFLTSNDSNAP